MKSLILTLLISTSLLSANDLITGEHIISGTTRTFEKENTKVTNVDITLFGDKKFVGAIELDKNAKSEYSWTNVSKGEIVQKGRPIQTVFLFNGPYDYPAVRVEGKLVKTDKGYTSKDIRFSYLDPRDQNSEIVERISGFIIKYGDTYLVNWTFKENLHDADDTVFAGKLYGRITVKNELNEEGLKITEAKYELSANNLRKVQIANFMKWWLSCVSHPPAVE